MIFVVLGILDAYGVNISGLIASIGIAGVIVGLALQDMVADFLSGLLILFDNHYSIGDTVTIDGFTGEVANFGLMTTKIKAATGEVMILSNSSFKKVINYNMNNTTHYINIDVAYDTDINKLEKCLNEMKDEVEKISGYIGNYKLLGIQEFASSSIKYMIMLECVNSQRFQVKRDFNMILKKYFDKYKIEIPYMKVDVNIRGNNE
jgi:small conductance mechanosensitive channel